MPEKSSADGVGYHIERHVPFLAQVNGFFVPDRGVCRENRFSSCLNQNFRAVWKREERIAVGDCSLYVVFGAARSLDCEFRGADSILLANAIAEKLPGFHDGAGIAAARGSDCPSEKQIIFLFRRNYAVFF